MVKVSFFLLVALFSLSFAEARVLDPSQGTITSPVFSFKFGAAPGTDFLDLSGTFVQGSGAPALNLPGDIVSLNFNGGTFRQSLPANSFSCNSTTCTYTNTGASGITSFQIKPAAKTFSVSVRKADFTGASSARLLVTSFSVGTNVFSFVPNSLPVSAISGPTSATIGSLLTFDATGSTDYNSDTLSFAWSLISRPLGSAATLSSTGNATTSITPDVGGAYILRVQASDPQVGGIPALITVNATGATSTPPPPPSASNGFITLSSDFNSYVIGQQANLSLTVNVPDGNGARRYFFSGTYDDAPITLVTVTNQQSYSFQPPAFTASGTHVLKVVQYTETTDIATDLVNSISNYTSDIAACQKALQFETSPQLIQQLQAQISADQAQIAIDNQQLSANRTQVGGPAVLSISVN